MLEKNDQETRKEGSFESNLQLGGLDQLPPREVQMGSHESAPHIFNGCIDDSRLLHMCRDRNKLSHFVVLVSAQFSVRHRFQWRLFKIRRSLVCYRHRSRISLLTRHNFGNSRGKSHQPCPWQTRKNHHPPQRSSRPPRNVLKPSLDSPRPQSVNRLSHLPQHPHLPPITPHLLIKFVQDLYCVVKVATTGQRLLQPLKM
jgi:hypothetical protein